MVKQHGRNTEMLLVLRCSCGRTRSMLLGMAASA